LVTGTTGFVGKVILEKMLYSLPDIEIIVLIRGKKGSSVEERLKKEIVDSECFSRIKERERGNYV
jgi:thioester reductase-like protein